MVSAYPAGMKDLAEWIEQYGSDPEKIRAFAEIIGEAADLPAKVAVPYTINFVFWGLVPPQYGMNKSHDCTSRDLRIPNLCADARTKIDAAFTLLFT